MFRATFIGVDKYADSTVRELTGAVRDATALWALVSDSMPGAVASLLTNADATIVNIRAAIHEALTSAGEDDTVILTFSGHGNRSQRLVTYDTSRNSLDASTIGMDELAAAFKGSKAKAILCVIDCCFSGAAPARVLDDSPVSRDPGMPLEELAGAGRILISACHVNEVAYESPAYRHGLLTLSLIRALQAWDEQTIDLVAAMAAVMQSVRAAAGQLGVTQTPILLGHVEGGLVLPRLVAGSRFLTAFPEATGIRVSAAVNDLNQFGIPQPVLDEWTSRFRGGLNTLQVSAVNDYRILDGESLLVVAPTSSGKTFIGEMAATKAILDGRKAVFLLPYRALVNEKYDLFGGVYGEKLGMRVIRCTGDHTDETDQFVRGKYEIAVLTYEMFLNLGLRNVGVLNQIGLIVLDEAQFITDPVRGIAVELILTYLLAARQRGVVPQLIALSAVIGHINHFDEWLACRTLVTTVRPVPLLEGVLDRSGQFQFVDADGNEQLTQLVPYHAIQVRREKPSAQDVIVPLVKQLVRGTTEKIIVFRNRRGPAEGCAGYLASDVGLPPAADALALLPGRDLSSTSAALRRCLNGGTAFHNTNLTREEKQVVERAYRDPNSNLRILGATTTVAAGINTPASTVIIAEQEFIGEDGRPFTVAEYKNMAGRAGRLGYNEEGKAIILANDSSERQFLFRRYVRGTLEPLQSSFDANQLETWIIRLLAQVKQVHKDQVLQLLLNTFGGFLDNRRHPGWQNEMEQRLRALLADMIRLRLVEQELNNVQLTLLGRACGESSLSFRSAMRLVDLVQSVGAQGITAEQLMALVQALPESDSNYTPMFKKGTKESVRPREAASHFGLPVANALQRFADDYFAYYARCKRASILWDWINGVSIERIEETYTANPYQGKIGYGDIRKFADSTRFHLSAAHRITNILFVSGGPTEATIDCLLRQLEFGMPAQALRLVDLPVDLTRGDYLALLSAGIHNPNQVWQHSDEQLSQLLGPLVGRLLSSKRPKLHSQSNVSAAVPSDSEHPK
jgi:replicative superfamily II helicase